MDALQLFVKQILKMSVALITYHYNAFKHLVPLVNGKLTLILTVATLKLCLLQYHYQLHCVHSYYCINMLYTCADMNYHKMQATSLKLNLLHVTCAE